MNANAVYLDHNASAPLLPEARAALLAALDSGGNPSSIHRFGRSARAHVEAAREAVAATAGAEAGQVVFTSGATEAIAQGMIGGARAFGVTRILIGATEHAAVQAAAAATGLPVDTLPVDGEGVIDLAALDAALAAASEAGALLLVAIQAVNNETGVLQPLAAIESRLGATPHLLLIDAVQLYGRRPLDFAARAADMMALSGHKIGAPSGIGALLLKGHADEVRLIAGGGQERGRRGGTEAVALIAGFGAAATAFPHHYDAARVMALRDRLEDTIRAYAADAVIFGAGAHRLETTVAFALPGVANTTALMALDLAGVALSSGSACASGKVARSHVLDAMGVAPALADGALRASLGWSSTEQDIAAFAAALEKLPARRTGGAGKAA